MKAVGADYRVLHGLRRIRQAASRLKRWWLRELEQSFPSKLANWLLEDGSHTLVVVPQEKGITLLLRTGRGRLLAQTHLEEQAFSRPAIDAFLHAHRMTRESVAVALRLQGASVFARNFAVPLQARSSLETIIVRDLATRTPFDLDDIVHAHLVREGQDRFFVSQWAARRKHVLEQAGALGLEWEDLAQVEFGSSTHETATAVLSAHHASHRVRWLRDALVVLAISAVMLALGALGSRYYAQQSVLDALAGEMETRLKSARTVQAELQGVRKLHEKLAHLRSLKNGPGLLDVWEETTRILPSHSWLTELRMSSTSQGRQMTVTGFSAAGSQLVALFDQSPLFQDTALAGPVTLDAAENKERFSLQFRISGARTAEAPVR